MEFGWKDDDVFETTENDESGRAIVSGLADEGKKYPNSTSKPNKVVRLRL